MPIRVVSKRKGGVEAEDGELIVYVGRPHVLGNPTPLGSDRNRPAALRVYGHWLRFCYGQGGTPQREAIDRLAVRVAAGERLALQCWCSPKACHADIIKQLIEEVVNGKRDETKSEEKA